MISGTFVEVAKPTVPTITQIEAGSFHSMMLVSTGEIFAWGDNFYGQIGIGYVSSNSEPTQYYVSRNYDEPEMIDEPKRIKKFDFTSVEADSNSALINYTITGYVLLRINSQYISIISRVILTLCLQENFRRKQRNVYSGAKHGRR